MAIVLIALVTLSVSAFAADNGKQISESTFQENVVVKVSNAGKFMKEEEEFEILTPEEISSMKKQKILMPFLRFALSVAKFTMGAVLKRQSAFTLDTMSILIIVI